MSSGGDSFGTVRLAAGPVPLSQVSAGSSVALSRSLPAFTLTTSVHCWRTPLKTIVSMLSLKLGDNPPLKGHHGAGFGP